MTVAPEQIPFPLRGAGRLRLSRRWERAMIVLGICLPVPLAAFTGLSIPLPTTVERLAAALVPWANAATLDENQALASGEVGSIVLAPAEQSADRASSGLAVPSAADNPRPQRATGTAPDTPGGAPANKDGGGRGGSGNSGGSTPTGSEDPPAPPSPVQGVVDEVDKATAPVVGEAEGTVTGVVGTVDETIDDVLSGLGK